MNRQNRGIGAGLAAMALSAMLFAWLAMAVMRDTAGGFDQAVRGAVHSWATPALTSAMETVTQLGSSLYLLAWGIVAVVSLAMRGRRRAAALLAICGFGGEAWDEALKLVFRRPRPVPFYGQAPWTYSFPSGHTVASCCFYCALAAILAAGLVSVTSKMMVWIAAVAITLAVGFSRIYLGVHYPTDVIGGYLAAIFWLALVWTVYRGQRN
jgi:undecaprenyl-diphosphatase